MHRQGGGYLGFIFPVPPRAQAASFFVGSRLWSGCAADAPNHAALDGAEPVLRCHSRNLGTLGANFYLDRADLTSHAHAASPRVPSPSSTTAIHPVTGAFCDPYAPGRATTPLDNGPWGPVERDAQRRGRELGLLKNGIHPTQADI